MTNGQENSKYNAEFVIKCLIAMFSAFVQQVIYLTSNEEFLRWIRNRLAEPYGVIQKKLDESKHLAQSSQNHSSAEKAENHLPKESFLA